MSADDRDKRWSLDTLLDLGVKIEKGERPYVFELQDAYGNPCGKVRYSPNGVKPKAKADPGTERQPWPRPEAIEGDVLWTVEGEPDAISMAELGLPAVALPGSGKYQDDWPGRLAAGRRMVVLLGDCDGVGRARMRSMAEKVARLGVEARMVDLDPARDDGYDVGDVLTQLGPIAARELVDSLVAATEPWQHEPSARTAEPTPTWPEPLTDEAFYGLAGRFVKALAPHSEADPAALLVQTLAAFGNVIGRGPGWKVEGDYHATNLYVAVVGDTAKARKGVSWGRVRELFASIDPEWATDRNEGGLSSGEGVIWHVRDATTKRRKAKPTEILRADDEGFIVEVDDPGVTDKRLFVQEAELAQCLKVMAREGNVLSPALRALWDHGNHGTLTKNSPVRTTGAHVSVVGHITAGELRRHLTETESANGFANRFLFVCARRSQELPFGGSFGRDSLAPFTTLFATAVQTARQTPSVSMTGPATRLWSAVYGELSNGRPGLLGAITARAEAQVIRLAVIYALLDNARTIDRRHLEAAVAVWRYCEDSAAFVFGDTIGNPLADRLLTMIRAAGDDGITRGELRDAISHKTTLADFDAALSNVERRLFAARVRESTAGRDRERWYAHGGAKPDRGDESPDAEPSIPQRRLSSPADDDAEQEGQS